jgi:hypothetical protein
MAGKKKTRGGISKAEAVRRAIGDLGRDAKPLELQAHIRVKYGIEMSAGHVKVEKGKFLRKQRESAAARGTAQGAAAGGGKPARAASRRTRAGGMTKAEVVRRALGDLGRDAKPLELKDHILKRYGIEMSAEHISTEKRKALLQGAGKGKAVAAGAPAQPSAARTAEPRVPASTPAAESALVGLDDVVKIKDLVDRVGASSLKQLIDVFAR